jgi:DNA-3-methyladenine glycosylase
MTANNKAVLGKKLDKRFYLQRDVVVAARSLLGKYLFTRFDGQLTGGIITETEAYAGEIDKASHAFGGRRTNRTETMYSEGGTAYVYLCYGMYSLFNVVTNKKDIPHAVLIRAIHPIAGLDIMEKRRKMKPAAKNFSAGPGTLSIALGIHFTAHNGLPLEGGEIWIEDRNLNIVPKQILVSPRVGVESAGKDALLPYRFRIKAESLV